MERFRGPNGGEGEARELGRGHRDAAGEPEHRVHQPRARVRLERDLVAAEPEGAGDGLAHALVLAVEDVEAAEPSPAEDLVEGPLLAEHRLPDRADAREIEVAGFLVEPGGELVDGEHRP